jgi:hypothetical protein
MADWAERLRAKIGVNLSRMTGLASAEDGVQFEETLGALFRWLDGIDANRRFALMVKPDEGSDEAHPAQFQHFLTQAASHGDRFLKRLNESLFEEFGPDRIDADKAVRAYRRLFELLKMGDPFPIALVCATTNYDRSIEIALDAMGMTPRTGFTSHAFRTPVLAPEGLGAFDATPALLYLHGAVGWYRRDDGSIQAMPADQGFNPTHGRPAVLYPSPNKDLEISETSGLWGEFRRAVQQATHILVLGHALNDKHLVAELASTKARIAVTYRVPEPADADMMDIEDFAAKQDRIKKLLPGATPIGMHFASEPNLVAAADAVDEWRS